MSYASDDLTPLLVPQPGPGVGFRQGTVLTWNQQTAENTINVAGSTLTNLPILNTNEAVLLQPGDVVGILTAGPSWFIMGRITVPGTSDAATALNMVSSRIRAANVFTVESTTSTTYTDLATVGPQLVDVAIGAAGKCLVIVSAEMQQFSGSGVGGSASFDVSGATTLAASTITRLMISRTDSTGAHNLRIRSSSVHLLDALNPGLHTFTMKYRSEDGVTLQWLNRTLTVFAL